MCRAIIRVELAVLQDLLGFNLQPFYPREWERGTTPSDAISVAFLGFLNKQVGCHPSLVANTRSNVTVTVKQSHHAKRVIDSGHTEALCTTFSHNEAAKSPIQPSTYNLQPTSYFPIIAAIANATIKTIHGPVNYRIHGSHVSSNNRSTASTAVAASDRGNHHDNQPADNS